LLAISSWRLNGWRFPDWSSWKILQSQPQSHTPEDAIYTMIDAARAGDTRAYLDAFSCSMKDDVAQVIKETGNSAFASYLTRNAAFRGVAVNVIDRPSGGEARVRVEYVYAERNEVQNLYLKRDGARWRICSITGAEQRASPFPFGTQVTD
jgi:hypothetical protein